MRRLESYCLNGTTCSVESNRSVYTALRLGNVRLKITFKRIVKKALVNQLCPFSGHNRLKRILLTRTGGFFQGSVCRLKCGDTGRLKYDVAAGIIEFSEEATITESGNQISSNYLLYNINERRIKADSSGSDDDRVRITYTPAAEEDATVEDGENP